MQAHAIEGVAEDERLAELRVVERLDAEVVARAEEAMFEGVPNRKREVADQMCRALISPRTVGAEDQLRIPGISSNRLARVVQRGGELVPRVDARVGDDEATAVDGERLFICPGSFAVVDDVEQR